ncbi:MAG: sulfatase-like hydrolase/transferase [Opitutales bacterium]|nr:sulfatase-like hydrolase/transferase [Opitutales bacterium]
MKSFEKSAHPQNFARTSAIFLSLWALSFLSFFAISILGRLVLWIFAAGTDFAFEDSLAAWTMASRYDFMVAAYLSMPLLLLMIFAWFLPKSRSRLIVAGTAISAVLTAILSICFIFDFGFFCEYQDQFNVWVLGLVHDDRNAIVRTIANDYHWGRYLFALVVALTFFPIFVFPGLAKKIIRKASRSRLSKWAATAAIVFLVFFNVVILRGRLSGRPLGIRDAAVCTDMVKNRLILNPMFALKHVLIDVWKISDGAGTPDFVQDINAQMILAYGAGTPGQTISERISRKNVPAVPAALFKQPKQIFLIVLESGDQWPLREAYAELGLADDLKSLAATGASSDNFVSNAGGTMLSLSSIISGVPDIGVAQNYRPNGQKMLPVALAGIFKRLGYKTRFAYAGYGFWQHVEKYVRDQGFDEAVFGSDISDCPEKFKGEWGVPDGYLFDYLEKLAKADGDTPTFTLVMTASNHPPYSLTEEVPGYKDFSLPQSFEKIYDRKAPLRVYAHQRYGNHAAVNFVKNIQKTVPDSLFAITGDHFSRRFLNARPDFRDGKQVPFVLCGANVPAGTRLPFGTHKDIVPTLLSCCAPQDFEYPSFGCSLFSPAAQARRGTIACGTVLHAGGGFAVGNEKSFYGVPVTAQEAAEITRIADAHRAVEWYYFEKGETLPPAK